MSFFPKFPLVAYRIDDQGTRVLLTNIARRFVVRREVIARNVLFEPYVVADGERPDIVAYKYYEDSGLDWLVLLSNRIMHPQFDWFMGYQDFKNYIIGKYGSVQAAHQTVHHYEKRVLTQRLVSNGLMTDEMWLVVDETTYHDTPDDERRIISAYKYEDTINKSRDAKHSVDSQIFCRSNRKRSGVVIEEWLTSNPVR